MRIEINNHIVIDSDICHGKPTFKGTRIMVKQVLELLEAGISFEEILRDYYPQLSKDSIRGALNYASNLVEDEKYVAF